MNELPTVQLDANLKFLLMWGNSIMQIRTHPELLVTNFDGVLVVALQTGRARTLEPVSAGTKRLREVEPRVHGVAHLISDFNKISISCAFTFS